MKVTVSKIFIDDEIKQGKFGPSQKIGIKIQEPTVTLEGGDSVSVDDRWLYGFLGKTNKGWKNGDIVEINISERESGDKKYLNFKSPNPENDRIAKMESDIKKLNEAVFGARVNEEKVIQVEDKPDAEPEF